MLIGMQVAVQRGSILHLTSKHTMLGLFLILRLGRLRHTSADGVRTILSAGTHCYSSCHVLDVILDPVMATTLFGFFAPGAYRLLHTYERLSLEIIICISAVFSKIPVRFQACAILRTTYLPIYKDSFVGGR